MDIMEKTYGITEYVSDYKGFFGIIKQRYSDFVVNEITSSGEVVHLTKEEPLPVPKPPVYEDDKKQPPEIQDHQFEQMKVISGEMRVGQTEPSVALVDTEFGKDYQFAGPRNDPKNNRELKLDVGELSKERRTMIHRFIKTRFSNLNSVTKEIGQEKFIIVNRQDNTQKKDKRMNSWPKAQNYVKFVLYKENIDTMEAINVLAGKLRLRPATFSYAGTKDRRGKTSQMVSVFQVPPNNLLSASRALHKIRIGNFSFGHKALKLGQARGNTFKIVLREVSASPSEIEEGTTSLKERGFINYFGMQRFSSSSVSTHEIGKALLQGEYHQAIDLILSARENDWDDMASAKQVWIQQRNARAACNLLRPMMRQNSIEGLLLAGLARHGDADLLNALQRVPRNTRLMYIHAYQSYLWNRVVSRRIQKYGLKVLAGDTVKRKNRKTDQASDSSSALPADEMEEDKDASGDPPPGDGDDEGSANPEMRRIQILPQDEVELTNVADVLMPMPGFNTIYPENEMKDWYMEYLREDGLTIDMFKNKVKSFSLGGAYRLMMGYPLDLKHSTCFYDDPTLSLVQSDLDVLENVEVEHNKLAEGTHQALILEFCLPTSTYATMALRELLKMETSSKYQSTLNNRSSAASEETELEDNKRKCDDVDQVEKKLRCD